MSPLECELQLSKAVRGKWGTEGNEHPPRVTGHLAVGVGRTPTDNPSRPVRRRRAGGASTSWAPGGPAAPGSKRGRRPVCCKVAASLNKWPLPSRLQAGA